MGIITSYSGRPHCHFIFCSNVTCQKLYYFMMRTPIPCLYLQSEQEVAERINVYYLHIYQRLLFTHHPSTYDTVVIIVKHFHSTAMKQLKMHIPITRMSYIHSLTAPRFTGQAVRSIVSSSFDSDRLSLRLAHLYL